MDVWVCVCLRLCTYVCVNACAKTCTCIYLNIACYHPYSTRLFYMPSSHFLCPSPLHVLLLFFFTLLTLFVRFACQSALNIVALLLQLLPPPPPLCLARTNRWAADKEIVVAKSRGGGEHSISVIDIAALCILSIAYQSLVYHSSS